MSRILTYIEYSHADCFHRLGQELLIPFSSTCGRSYRTEYYIPNEFDHSNTIRKAMVVFIALIILPITLIAGAVGACLLQCSSTHKDKYRLISSIQYQARDTPPAIPTPPARAPRATDSVNDYNYQTLKAISDVIITTFEYRGLVRDVYPIRAEFQEGSMIAQTVYPSTPEELEIYQQRVPLIVSSVRTYLEERLNMTIQIPRILQTLEVNHRQLFGNAIV